MRKQRSFQIVPVRLDDMINRLSTDRNTLVKPFYLDIDGRRINIIYCYRGRVTRGVLQGLHKNILDTVPNTSDYSTLSVLSGSLAAVYEFTDLLGNAEHADTSIVFPGLENYRRPVSDVTSRDLLMLSLHVLSRFSSYLQGAGRVRVTDMADFGQEQGW